MKRETILAGALLSFAVALPAAAHEVVYFADLSGPAESPANASPGTGTAQVTFDLDLATLRVAFSFSGLTGITAASHIHCCTAVPGTLTAGVATQTPTFVGFPLGVTFGTYDQTFDMTLASSYNPAFVTAQGSIGNAFNALAAGLDGGNAYLNIHTDKFPGGEIRGFLHPVPEPETYLLMLAGLGMLGIVARRRVAQPSR